MLKLDSISKVYDMSSYKIEALKDITVEFRESEFVSILGPSGCGKSTLLNIIGGLDKYSFGWKYSNNPLFLIICSFSLIIKWRNP